MSLIVRLRRLNDGVLDLEGIDQFLKDKNQNINIFMSQSRLGMKDHIVHPDSVWRRLWALSPPPQHTPKLTNICMNQLIYAGRKNCGAKISYGSKIYIYFKFHKQNRWNDYGMAIHGPT